MGKEQVESNETHSTEYMILIRWYNLPRKLQSDVDGEVGDLLKEGALSAASFLLAFEVLSHGPVLNGSLVALKITQPRAEFSQRQCLL